MPSAAKSATAEIEQPAIRPQAVRNQVVELQTPNRFPFSTDCRMWIFEHALISVCCIGF